MRADIKLESGLVVRADSEEIIEITEGALYEILITIAELMERVNIIEDATMGEYYDTIL